MVGCDARMGRSIAGRRGAKCFKSRAGLARPCMLAADFVLEVVKTYFTRHSDFHKATPLAFSTFRERKIH